MPPPPKAPPAAAPGPRAPGASHGDSIPLGTPASPQAKPGELPPDWDLLLGLEEQLEHLPLARSRPVQDAVSPGGKVPVLTGREVPLPAPEPLSEQEVLERFTALVDPFFQERERALGEPVAQGDGVLLSWEAALSGGNTLLMREQNVEARVLPDATLPGLFESLVGQKVGGRVQFSSFMPEDFPKAAARNKKVDFTVYVHRAVERTPPDVSRPELFQALGRGTTLEEVLGALAEEVQMERLEALDEQGALAVMDLLANEVEVFIPSDQVEVEIQEQWKAHRLLAEATGAPREPQEAWLADRQTRFQAEQRLRLDAALQALCARDKVSVRPEDEDGFLTALAQGFGVEPDALRADITRSAAAQKLVKKATWFTRAIEHAIAQVEFRYPEPAEAAGPG